MVEVIIAIVILAVGVLGMAGTTAYVIRQITLADVMTERAVALQTVVEQLQSVPFANVGSGTDSVGMFTMRWTSVSETTLSKLVTIVTSGPGLSRTSAVSQLAPAVLDTFQYRVISR
jgi:Tfp pilus assembly protein PilV